LNLQFYFALRAFYEKVKVKLLKLAHQSS